jgi:hypothetical protein
MEENKNKENYTFDSMIYTRLNKGLRLFFGKELADYYADNFRGRKSSNEEKKTEQGQSQVQGQPDQNKKNIDLNSMMKNYIENTLYTWSEDKFKDLLLKYKDPNQLISSEFLVKKIYVPLIFSFFLIQKNYSEEKSLISGLSYNNDYAENEKLFSDFNCDIYQILNFELFNGNLENQKFLLYQIGKIKEKDVKEEEISNLIILYRYYKLNLFSELKNNKYNYIHDYINKIKQLEIEFYDAYLNEKKKFKYNIYQSTKNKYIRLMEKFYENFVKETTFNHMQGWKRKFECEVFKSLKNSDNDLLKLNDYSYTKYLNFIDCTILIKNYTKNSSFYDNLSKLLLFYCNHGIFPIGNIVNSYILLCDIIHLQKYNMNLKFLFEILKTIKTNIYYNGNISNIFTIPLVQLKIFIVCHDIWDILMERKVFFIHFAFYLIKDIFEGISVKPYFRRNLKYYEDLNFLYYYYIFKKGIKHLIWNKNPLSAMKYFSIVSKNGIYNELNKKANECLKLCKLKSGFIDEETIESEKNKEM